MRVVVLDGYTTNPDTLTGMPSALSAIEAYLMNPAHRGGGSIHESEILLTKKLLCAPLSFSP